MLGIQLCSKLSRGAASISSLPTMAQGKLLPLGSQEITHNLGLGRVPGPLTRPTSS